MMMNMGNFTLPLRGAQAAIACIIMGFTAYVSNWWSKYWRDMAPAEINFLLFSSVWTLISLVYLVGTTVPQLRLGRFANRYAALAIEALTMAFWLRGFVALAVFLSARVCFGNVCNVAKAGVVSPLYSGCCSEAPQCTAPYSCSAHTAWRRARPISRSTTRSPSPQNSRPGEVAHFTKGISSDSWLSISLKSPALD